MGFFDIFKKKSTHEEKLYIAYDSLKKNSKETFFPDGIEQANNIILSISIILNKNLSDLTSKDYYNFLSMYFDTVYNKYVIKERKFGILLNLMFKYNITNWDDAKRIFVFSIINFSNSNYIISTDINYSEFDNIYDNEHYETFRDIIFKNQNIYSDDFGYSKENPICAFSINESYSFLSKLLTENDEKLYWLRTSSIGVFYNNGKINTFVDEYQLYLDGEKYKKIYICPYSYASEVVPKGLKLNDIEDHFQNLSYDAKTRGITVEELLELHKIKPTNLYEALLKI